MSGSSSRPTAAPVPSKDYARQYRALAPELMPAIERVLLGDEPVLGAELSAFEGDFAAYLGRRHGVGVGTGTDALVLALRALGVGPGRAVLTAANTFVATVHAIRQVGARPVLVDPDPRSMLLDAAGAAAALDALDPAQASTAVLLPVHLYGRVCEPELAEFARARGLARIDDVAQAHGARDRDGVHAGSGADLACYSFHPSKNLGAFGDGGAIVTDQSELDGRLRVLRNLGKDGKYDVPEVAPNSKLDTLQAAILRVKLPHLDAWVERRREHAAIYDEGLRGVGDLELPGAGAGRHAYHLYVVRTERRDALRAHLSQCGVKASLHYPIPPHLQPAHVDLGYGAGSLPVAEQLAQTVLSLPVSHELEAREIERVVDAVREFFRG